MWLNQDWKCEKTSATGRREKKLKTKVKMKKDLNRETENSFDEW